MDHDARGGVGARLPSLLIRARIVLQLSRVESHRIFEGLFFGCDTLHVRNTTANILERYEPFTASAAPRLWYMNGDAMVIRPSASVFDDLYGRWMSGEYQYSGVRAWFEAFGANRSADSVERGEDNGCRGT